MLIPLGSISACHPLYVSAKPDRRWVYSLRQHNESEEHAVSGDSRFCIHGGDANFNNLTLGTFQIYKRQVQILLEEGAPHSAYINL